MPTEAYLTAHTSDLHKIGANLPEAREFLLAYDPALKSEVNVERAFQNRWYGNASMGVCGRTTRHLARRFDRAPGYLLLLRAFLGKMDSAQFPQLNHFHMVLADKYYRWAASDFLAARFSDGRLEVPKATFDDALATQLPTTISRGGVARYGRNLLTSLRDNGYLEGRAEKEIRSPAIDVRTLGWFLYALQALGQGSGDFDGSPVYRALLKPRNLLLPTFVEGERLGWWEFAGDRNKLSVHLKHAGLAAWLEALS
ncbi:MAG: hypothetical protein WCG80_05180, partial [Spirochaetales bacterium]